MTKVLMECVEGGCLIHACIGCDDGNCTTCIGTRKVYIVNGETEEISYD